MKRPEQILQIQVVDWLRLAAPDLLYFAVPNAIGVKNARRIGGINKAMGVRAGVADLCFVLNFSYRNHKYPAHVAFIELKAPGTGHHKPNDNQDVFRKDCQRSGAPYAICDSLAQVEGTLRGWGVKLRAKVAA